MPPFSSRVHGSLDQQAKQLSLEMQIGRIFSDCIRIRSGLEEFLEFLSVRIRFRVLNECLCINRLKNSLSVNHPRLHGYNPFPNVIWPAACRCTPVCVVKQNIGKFSIRGLVMLLFYWRPACFWALFLKFSPVATFLFEVLFYSAK